MLCVFRISYSLGICVFTPSIFGMTIVSPQSKTSSQYGISAGTISVRLSICGATPFAHHSKVLQ